jgi:DNA repair protein RadC
MSGKPYIYTLHTESAMNIRLKKEEKVKILCSDDLYGIMQRVLVRESKIDRNREHLWTVSLDTAYRILNIELVSLGTINQTLVEPMEVYSVPLQKRAVRVILVHNHPSGELTPSESDKDVTDQLIQVGRIMHVPLMDHLIISEKDYYSFLDSGLLKELEQSLKYVPAYEIKRRYEKAAEEKGTEKGRKEERKEIARQMKKKGIDVELIMEFTGLSKGVIGRLKME